MLAILNPQRGLHQPCRWFLFVSCLHVSQRLYLPGASQQNSSLLQILTARGQPLPRPGVVLIASSGHLLVLFPASDANDTPANNVTYPLDKLRNTLRVSFVGGLELSDLRLELGNLVLQRLHLRGIDAVVLRRQG